MHINLEFTFDICSFVYMHAFMVFCECLKVIIAADNTTPLNLANHMYVYVYLFWWKMIILIKYACMSCEFHFFLRFNIQ